MRRVVCSAALALNVLMVYAGNTGCPPWDIACSHNDSSVPTDEQSAQGMLDSLDNLREYLKDGRVLVSKKLYMLGLTDSTKSTTEAVEFCYVMAGRTENDVLNQFEVFKYDDRVFQHFVEANYSSASHMQPRARSHIKAFSNAIDSIIDVRGDLTVASRRVSNDLQECTAWLKAYRQYIKAMGNV